MEEALGASTETEGGELQPIAARVLMKILYAARMCRYDLLRVTFYLAAQITIGGAEYATKRFTG